MGHRKIFTTFTDTEVNNCLIVYTMYKADELANQRVTLFATIYLTNGQTKSSRRAMHTLAYKVT